MLFLAVASVMPFRLDHRNFQAQRRAASLALPRGVPYLFISLDADTRSRHFALYALSTLAFPSPEVCWLVPVEAASHDGAQGAALAGLDGSVQHASGAQLALESYLANGVVLYESQAARSAMEARVPALQAARLARVIDPPANSPITLRLPSSEFSALRLARVAAIAGVAACLAGALFTMFAGRPGALLACFAAGAVGGPAVLAWFLSWAQYLPLRAPGVWPYAAWAASAGALWASLRRRHQPDLLEAIVRVSRRDRLLLVTAVGVGLGLCGLYLLRLDFDEDAHCHWLLMARSYFLRGRHLPELLQQHVSAASYPFAYGSLLALCGWLADSTPATFMSISPDTAVALLAYRVIVAGLDLGLLGALVWLLGLAEESLRYPVAAAALAFLFFPILQGQHSAADQLLFPLLAAAVLFLEGGRRLQRAGVVALGLVLAGVATFVRIEGGLLALMTAGPWLLGQLLASEGEPRWRRPGAWLAALTLGLLPTVLWKSTLTVTNTNFVWPSVEGAARQAVAAPRLWSTAGLILLREGWLPLLLVALPVAWLWSLGRGKGLASRVRDSLVPLATYACVAGFPAVYLFSTTDPVWHLRVSYARLLMLPLFSALVAVLVSAQGRRPASRSFDTHHDGTGHGIITDVMAEESAKGSPTPERGDDR